MAAPGVAPAFFPLHDDDAMWSRLRRTSLTTWIIASMVIGIALGWAFPDFATTLKPIATVFLRMIKSIVVPLIFSTLVVGIAGHGDDLKRVGRLALKSLVYFEVITTLALFVGLAAVNIMQPGVGVQLNAPLDTTSGLATTHATFASMLEHVVPQSFFEAASANDVLQIVFFTILFSIGLTRVQGKPREFMLSFCDSLAEVMFKFTAVVMLFAPFGIGAAIAVTIGQSGIGVLVSLGKLVLTLYVALVVFMLFVLLPVAKVTGVPIKRFVRAIKDPALIAFSTASSEAALPLAMEEMDGIGVPKRIYSFVIPTGYSFNLDGTTLYLSVASVFAAQAAGIHMDLGQQLVMLLTLMLTSKGVAGVPRAALVILAGTLATFGLPLEAVAVILGVDAIMDMARTSVNVIGNCLASVIVSRWEGELGDGPAREAEPEPEEIGTLVAAQVASSEAS